MIASRYGERHITKVIDDDFPNHTDDGFGDLIILLLPAAAALAAADSLSAATDGNTHTLTNEVLTL